ncbi:FixJ family two-component response regulator [Natronocella acetinitrilica]|uniref:FixJ family two-component response regulator n=1 Tax=Natronocella acetinitrilica TaxID=414046 RepID=A0AAE3G4Q6_9GAMM|nr:response regulator [Natronocella acetinitrilica]MCP1675332.1 FixJ family two-component response regulator [Natronocella acetinitrilica]
MDRLVHVVDDSEDVRRALLELLALHDLAGRGHAGGDDFLASVPSSARGCAVVDVRMPVMSGLELQQRMLEAGYTLPVVMVSAHGDVATAVRALKAGAMDFLQKPYGSDAIMAVIRKALDLDARRHAERLHSETILARLALLTDRERQILTLVTEGLYNKVIADRLGLSVSTVEADRNRLMKKLRAQSLYELVQIQALADAASRRQGRIHPT